uniref:Putative secreted protein n=1 Tax=Psorophora albipes TaxID=869069 RepID=T1DJ33_9DIPT
MKLLLVTIGILAVAFAFPNDRNDAGTSSAPPSDGQSDNEGGRAVAHQQPFINLAFIPVEFDPSWLNNSSGPIQPRPFIGWQGCQVIFSNVFTHHDKKSSHVFTYKISRNLQGNLLKSG